MNRGTLSLGTRGWGRGEERVSPSLLISSLKWGLAQSLVEIGGCWAVVA